MTTGARSAPFHNLMKYICLGYIDPKFFASMSDQERDAMMDSCFAYDDQLRANGHFKGGEALDSGSAMSLRYTNGKLLVTDGPFAETKEQLGGLMFLEARDLNHAVDLISKHPGAKYGPWEIFPTGDLSEMVRASEMRRLRMRTFKTSREFRVSPEKIFGVFQDTTRLAQWWGPKGFSNKFETCEFKAGGAWVFEMIGPDGKKCHNESKFSVIEPNRRVVIEHVSAPRFTLTISLEAIGTHTRVTWEQVFEDYAVANSVRAIVEPANEENLDRLAEAAQL